MGSTSSALREMHIKTTTETTSHPLSSKRQMTSGEKDVEKLEPSDTAGEKVNW